MKKLLGAAIMAGTLASFGAGAAVAEQLTYQLSGTFDAPSTGSFSGTYVYDTTASAFVSANIQTTEGLAYDGVTVLPAGSYKVIGISVSNAMSIGSSLPFTGQRGVQLQGIVPPLLAFREGICTASNCFTISLDPDTSRFATATITLAPAPFPTLSEWAMILLGVVLAGGAALTIQRRRMT